MIVTPLPTVGDESAALNDNSFVVLNPKDIDSRNKSLMQEVLRVYVKELPNMNYAANTGKQSSFLEKCVSGKYKTLILKSNTIEGPGEVIAAVSYQIVPSDMQYAEIPLAAVSSGYQRKGVGCLLYSELRNRLHNVGILTIFCWADKESEGFWLKQGFAKIGDVDGRGRVRKLPVRADIRKALCFPGDSTLMVSHLKRGTVHPEMSCANICVPVSIDPNFVEVGKDHNVLNNERLNLLDPQGFPCTNMSSGVGNSETAENVHCGGDKCSPLQQTAKRCIWEASLSSIKSKRVKGGHLLDSGMIVEELGGSVTPDGSLCTHIITGKARKTLNFCTALCSGSVLLASFLIESPHLFCPLAWILSSSWLKESYKEGKFLGKSKCYTWHLQNKSPLSSESNFILEDEDYALKYKSALRDAIIKARAKPQSLLKGYYVCLAKHIQPPADILCGVIKSAGGHVIHRLGNVLDPSKTIFIACEEDMEEAMLAAKRGICTYNTDWFMSCIMRQELNFEAPQFAESL
ncbi:hypothetical protein Taro_033438 [Colocasia esculenta]|uniref:N-acetyltransferase domain-containing protein n=1 Tax=Colocasia esculenta TaxID=4460 RepID=A0A843VVA6_COLES|nr:hypothetical protein [Colocasia esculenta]